MGTGKTCVAIQCSITPTLLLGRSDDFFTWERELLAEGIPSEKCWFAKSAKSRPPKHAEYIMYSWDMLRDSNLVKWILSYPFQMVIGDEVHSIKRWKSARTKAAHKAIVNIPYRIAATGTPLTQNAIEDAFSLGLFIDGGKTLGDDWWQFMRRHFIKIDGAGWVVKGGHYELIRKLISKIAIYIHEDDVLDLPPIVRTHRYVRMSGQQLKYYRRVLDEWDIEDESGRIHEFRYTLERAQKLMQIANGWFYSPTGKIVWLKSPKMDVLADLLRDELADLPKLVIWCAYRPEILRISRYLDSINLRHVVYQGGSKKLKRAARIQFMDDPSVRVFIAQVDQGVGMNELICANTAIYFSNSPRVVSKDQSAARTRRMGSERHDFIRYIEIIALNTPDHLRLDRLGELQDLSEWMLELCKSKKVSKFLTSKLSSE